MTDYADQLLRWEITRLLVRADEDLATRTIIAALDRHHHVQRVREIITSLIKAGNIECRPKLSRTRLRGHHRLRIVTPVPYPGLLARRARQAARRTTPAT